MVGGGGAGLRPSKANKRAAEMENGMSDRKKECDRPRVSLHCVSGSRRARSVELDAKEAELEQNELTNKETGPSRKTASETCDARARES